MHLVLFFYHLPDQASETLDLLPQRGTLLDPGKPVILTVNPDYTATCWPTFRANFPENIENTIMVY